MMTRHTRYFIIIFIVIQAFGCGLYGQRKDFQSWYEASLTKGLKNGLDLSGELELRMDGNSTQYDRSMVTLVAGYDLKDYLSIAGGLRVLSVADRETNLHPRYRIHADAMGKTSLSEVDLSFRVRLQYGFEDILFFNDYTFNSMVNRLRFKANHHIFGTRMEVFATLESWGLFNDVYGRFFKRMRYSAGLNYSLGFQSEFSLRYIIEDEFNQPNPLQSHVVVLGYSYKL